MVHFDLHYVREAIGTRDHYWTTAIAKVGIRCFICGAPDPDYASTSPVMYITCAERLMGRIISFRLDNKCTVVEW